MAVLTIRGVDEETRQRIKLRAVRNGHSMEAEVRQTLAQVYGEMTFGEAFLCAAEQFRHDAGGVDLDIPERSQPRVPDLGGGNL